MRKLRKVVLITIIIFIVTISASFNSFSMNNNSNDWKISNPKEQGMDPHILSGSERAIESDYRAVTSFLVIRHGYLVYEKYYLGNKKDNSTPVYSITKSVISALTGIAIREKILTGLDQQIATVYPEYLNNKDPLKKEITIKQMLSMTAGLESVDNNINAWEQSSDWFEYALNKPLISKPGEKFGYNSGLTHLLGGVISRSSNMSTKEFANKYLFGPLGITNYIWGTDPKGNYGSGHLLYLTSRDMAKLGYLYLKNGKWQGKQIVPEEWVKESTRIQAVPSDGRKYGYLWWLENNRAIVNNKEFFVFAAEGYNGQYIAVIPELDLVTVITCNAFLPTNKGDATFQLIVDYVIPAVL